MSLSFCFKPTQRIRKPAEFQHVFQARKKTFSQYFIVYQRSNSLTHARMGVIVSNKSAKLAVARNRIKRTVREYFREHQQHLCATDLVIIANGKAKNASRDELRQSLQKAFESLPGR